MSGSTGSEVAVRPVPSDQITEARDMGQSVTKPKYRYESKADEPEVLRKQPGFVPQDEAEQMLDASQALARRARDSFKQACEETTTDLAEASFLVAKQKLEDLWGFAHLRDQPFRDLLALLTVAIKKVEITDIDTTKRDVLRQAFADLPRFYLDDHQVEQHIERFAEHGIDAVASPISLSNGKQMKVRFEEMD